MKIEEFRTLNESEKVKIINKRLDELAKEGKKTKEFKCDEMEFSYTTAVREMEKVGYARNNNKFEKEYKLTEREIMMLKNLSYGYEFMMARKEDEPKVKRRTEDTISTTSIRMYADVWSRWQQFSKEWGIYNSVDLMASALESYMDRYDFEDIETLREQGKIKEK